MMPEVTAWECPRTQRLFRTLPEYKEYLVKTGEINFKRHKFLVRKKQNESKLAEFRRCTSFAEIKQWVMDNPEVFYINAFYNTSMLVENNQIPTESDKFRFKSIEFENLHFDECVSNSHNSPLGQPTNWRGLDDLPRGYPGFKGHVIFRYENLRPCSVFEIFKNTGLNTGGGGGGDGRYRCEVIFFAEDWPDMMVYKKLIGDSYGTD